VGQLRAHNGASGHPLLLGARGRGGKDDLRTRAHVATGVIGPYIRRTPENPPYRNCFAIVFCGSLSGQLSTIAGGRHPNFWRSPYVSHSLPVPAGPLQHRIGPVGAASRILREAWSSAEVVRPAHRRCRLLSSALGLCLADAPPRVPALADGLLPLPQVASGRTPTASS
jgi:hypothetical protein